VGWKGDRRNAVSSARRGEENLGVREKGAWDGTDTGGVNRSRKVMKRKGQKRNGRRNVVRGRTLKGGKGGFSEGKEEFRKRKESKRPGGRHWGSSRRRRRKTQSGRELPAKTGRGNSGGKKNERTKQTTNDRIRVTARKTN